MGFLFIGREKRRQGSRSFLGCCHCYRAYGRLLAIETEARLTPAHEFRIDLGQKFGVEQRAVLRAAAIVDAVTRAEIVELIGATRMAETGQWTQNDDTIEGERRP